METNVKLTKAERDAFSTAHRPNGGIVRVGKRSVDYVCPLVGQYWLYKNSASGFSVTFSPANPFEKGWRKEGCSFEEAKELMGF